MQYLQRLKQEEEHKNAGIVTSSETTDEDVRNPILGSNFAQLKNKMQVKNNPRSNQNKFGSKIASNSALQKNTNSSNLSTQIAQLEVKSS